ncbi:LRAT-like domain [Macleaya cordata]|uniref:LRAT-like domain n=1 Tax=Macleaya cordata TaxID=56857 RepID=A0A200QW93_MACCD|nr:LRAT-like domain [Macleaya cordata]
MGILSNGAERSEIKAGDHIYTWRVVYAYSHHGIYLGGSKVVHFTQEQDGASTIGTSVNPSGSSLSLLSNLNSFNSSGSRSNLPSNCPTFPDCGFKQPNSGVILSCLDCFLGSGSLYLFEYGVTPSIFFAKVRGGTCTTAKSDPPDIVIHRAMYLLQKGFGNYDIFLNNCEDFALYCKTGLLTLDKSGVGRSGQASSIIGAPLAAVLFTPLKFLMPGPVGVAVTAGMYCMSRYATDIGVRSDVIKVAVEDMSVNTGWVRRAGKEVVEEEVEEVSKKQVPRNGLGTSSIVKEKKSS